MKLISCHVENFGKIHDFDYNFDDGMNIILEDNGWGKTTFAAFLKSMIYGMDTSRRKNITENERRRYMPWQGGTYGGSLDFEVQGKRYRVEREFGSLPSKDKVHVKDLDTGSRARINHEKLGEEIFHIDAKAFEKSVYITQNGLYMDNDAASSIHTRLNSIVSQANDVVLFDSAVDALTNEIKLYEKTGNRGRIGDLLKEITVKERERNDIERKIQEQDRARTRISAIDIEIQQLDSELKLKNEQLKSISGDEKKIEAYNEQLKDISSKIDVLKGKIESIKEEFKYKIPDDAEIKSIRDDIRNIAENKIDTENINNELNSCNDKYNDLIKRYENGLPDKEFLNDIQVKYIQLHNALSSADIDSGEYVQNEQTEQYDMIRSAVESDGAYIQKVKSLRSDGENINKLKNEAEKLEERVNSAKVTWKIVCERYERLKLKIEEIKSEVSSMSDMNSDDIDESIRELKYIRNDISGMDMVKAEINSSKLNEEEESLVKKYEGRSPDIDEGNNIISRLRHIAEENNFKTKIEDQLKEENYSYDVLKEELVSLENKPVELISEDIDPDKLIYEKPIYPSYEEPTFDEEYFDKMFPQGEDISAETFFSIPDDIPPELKVDIPPEIKEREIDIPDELKAQECIIPEELQDIDAVIPEEFKERENESNEGSSAEQEQLKSKAPAVIGVGAGIAVVGIIAGMAVMPVLFVLAAIGIVIIAGGAVMHRSFKNEVKLREEKIAKSRDDEAARAKARAEIIENTRLENERRKRARDEFIKIKKKLSAKRKNVKR